MRTAPVFALVAALLTAPLAATPKKSDPDNPPIVTEQRLNGAKIRVQIFDRPAVTIGLDQLSIAQRKMLRINFGDTLGEARTVTLLCLALTEGKVVTDPCNQPEPDAVAIDLMPIRLATEMLRLSAAPLPSVPVKPANRNKDVFRYARLEVHLPALPASDPEPPTGPLVNSYDIKGLDRLRKAADYPVRALALHAEGRMILACQVQTDLSVACTQESFDPPENGRFFRDIANAFFRDGRVEATLADGGSAVGARFRFAMRFSVPE